MDKKKKKQQDSSDSEDEGPAIYSSKMKKNSVKQVPPVINEVSTKTSQNFMSNLAKERGFDINDQEFCKIIPQTQGVKQNQKTMSGFVEGQSDASLGELEKELSKALKANNKLAAASIIDTILSKDIDQEKKFYYLRQRCEFLFDSKQFLDCINLCKDQLKKVSFSLVNVVALRLFLAKSLIETNALWNGYLEMMRLNSLTKILRCTEEERKTKIKEAVNSEKDLSWKDTEIDELLHKVDDYNLSVTVKIDREKQIVNQMFITGSSPSHMGLEKEDIQRAKDKHSLFNLKIFKNRRVFSVSCGENHCLAVISGCSCINPSARTEMCEGKLECNGGSDVVGWGDNGSGQVNGEPSTTFVETPQVLRELVGKNIQGLSACKASSVCFDKFGNIYEWGANKLNGLEKIERTFKMKEEIVDCKKGHKFSVFLTGSGKVYLLGKIEAEGGAQLSRNEPEQISPDKTKIDSIVTGYNHILCLSREKKLYLIGSNSHCQLGVDEKELIFRELKAADNITKFGIASIAAFNNTSMIINNEGELFYWGQLGLSDKKIQQPKFAEIPDDSRIVSAGGFQKQFFTIDELGRVSMWDVELGSKLKIYENTQNEIFREMTIGKNFQIFLKTFLEPKRCFVDTKDKERLEFESYSLISLPLHLQDKIGPYRSKIFYPTRIECFLSKKPNEDYKNLELGASKTLFKEKSKYGENKFYAIELEEKQLKNLNVTANKHDVAVWNIEFTVEKQDDYYLYVLVNEELIRDQPINIFIKRGIVQEQKEKNQEIQKAEILRAEELKKEKQREALMQMEKLKQTELEEQENLLKRRKETDKRADEALKKHLLEQQEKEAREEAERKLKKDLITGGGFDLNKQQQLNKGSAMDDSKKNATATTVEKRGSLAEKKPAMDKKPDKKPALEKKAGDGAEKKAVTKPTSSSKKPEPVKKK